jgi:hypothetical protein
MPSIDFQNPDVQQTIFIIISLWSLVWKGFALYKAARKEQKVWFVLVLVVNTLGILEIVYFFWLNKIDLSKLWVRLVAFKDRAWQKR